MKSFTAPLNRLERLAPEPWLLGVYWLIIFAGSHVPTDFATSSLSLSDKLVHWVAFAGLSFLSALALRRHQMRRGRSGYLTFGHYAMIFGVIAAYGIFDELTQPYVGRTCDSLDWVSDICGAATGLGVFALLVKLLRRPE